ncbi:DUF389 domain-containing protein [Phaeocystidibacter luteus]|uniref:DUF389 domain-containing protein n=1 Tax=Phaeocystidibacter luteus TaxID=911197 RepID=A0A6N6RGR5_9FLAO|nr:DUF389 domain-containing protein [Phaeocystidibacter luteus]KAB2810366.1 DUF389 domain-containing protein [Phaeocystidibacter luteus]
MVEDKNQPADSSGEDISDAVVEEQLKKEEDVRKESEFYFRRFIRTFREFIKHRLSIIDNANPQSTIEGIEKDVEFRGFNLWILILSIFICSIGLNVNSPAVIVGAMLISPLMGPIMGVGLSVGINDIVLLKRSLRNWGVAVLMAILSSTLFFLIAPTIGTQSELLARTQPTLLDVMVAIFGGAAGILAGSRREKNNVIPGVAIATALMPPLCTAGYGIATGNLFHFGGAMYLFLINSIFISLATTLVVRYLKYPARKLADPLKEKRTRRIIIFVLIVFVLPSAYVFYNVVDRTYRLQKIEAFIAEDIHVDRAMMMDPEITFEGDAAIISLAFLGEQIPDKMIASWEKQAEARGLNNIVLNVVQVDNSAIAANGEEMQRIASSLIESQNTLQGKDSEIARLKDKLDKLAESGLPKDLIEGIRIYNPEISEIYAGQLQLSNATRDTICTLLIKFDPSLELEEAKELEIKTKLRAYVRSRLGSDTVFVTEL